MCLVVPLPWWRWWVCSMHWSALWLLGGGHGKEPINARRFVHLHPDWYGFPGVACNCCDLDRGYVAVLWVSSRTQAVKTSNVVTRLQYCFSYLGKPFFRKLRTRLTKTSSRQHDIPFVSLLSCEVVFLCCCKWSPELKRLTCCLNGKATSKLGKIISKINDIQPQSSPT